MSRGRTSLRRDLATFSDGWRWGRRGLVPRSVAPLKLPPREFPTAWARGSKARVARAALQRYGLGPILATQTDRRIEGLDVFTDLAPPVIFVANHSSHLDAPLVLTSLPAAWRERTATGAAADYFFDAWWRAAITALIFNAFPVERAGSKGRATRIAGELLDQGWNLLVFPEGTRTPDGWMRPFRHGAAVLATEHRVPVVPVAIRGSYQAMPRGRAWIRSGKPPVSLRFGRAVHPGIDERAEAFNPRIEAALAELLDEERTDWWQARVRAANGEALPSPSGASATTGPEGPRWLRVWEASRPIARPRRAFPR